MKIVKAESITMIVLGIFAIVFPSIAFFNAPLFFGLLFILAGIAQIIYAVQSRGIGRGFWKLILGLLDLLAGVIVLIYPLGGVSIAFPLIAGTTIDLLLDGVWMLTLHLGQRST
jgi:uncharacterized membrane protein HdeD (DUF308 family)